MKHSRNAIHFGLKMFAGIGLFFIITNIIGLGHVTELRLVNILIIMFFSARLARENVIDNEKINYLENLSSLFLANVINVALSVIGFVIYVSFIDPSFFAIIKEGLLFAHVENLYQVVFILAAEGLAGGAVVSFGMMQYWKDYKRVRKPVVFE